MIQICEDVSKVFCCFGRKFDYRNTCKEGKKVAKPADLTTGGYTFGGWFTDRECKSAYHFDTSVTKDTTLYAKWTMDSRSSSGDNGSSSSSSGKTSAKTGDERNVGLWLILMAGSLLSLVPVLSKKKAFYTPAAVEYE